MLKEKYGIYDTATHTIISSRRNTTLEAAQKEFAEFLEYSSPKAEERYIIAKVSYEEPEKEVVKWGVYNKATPPILLFNVFNSKEEAEELAIGYPNLQVISFTVKE